MAYDSIPHDGITTGHAASTDVWSAPYSSTEWADFWKKVFSSNAARGFVVPGYGNNLKVSENNPTALTLLLETGAAFIRGRAFENTAQVTLNVTANPGALTRMDRVILEYDSTAQTITPKILTGVAGSGVLPSLTQSDSVYQISLAWYYIPGSNTTVEGYMVHDERVFESNFESLLTSLGQPNLIHNSEYMAWSALDHSASFVDAPEGWTAISIGSIASATRPSQMSRGRAVALTVGSGNRGMFQSFPVKASTMYAIKVLHYPVGAVQTRILVATDSASPATIDRRSIQIDQWLEETIYYMTESDATTLTIQLLCTTGTARWGQVLAVEGYNAGSYRQVHEHIPFKYRLDDTSWDGDVKADGTHSIDLDTAYSGLILENTQSVLINYMASDTGSAGGSSSAPYMQIRTTNNAVGSDADVVSQLRFAGAVNSSIVSGMAEVPLDFTNIFYVTTSDQTQLTAYLYIVGINT